MGLKSYSSGQYLAPVIFQSRSCHCRSLLVGNGLGFRAQVKIVHSNQEVSVSLVAPWEDPCYINGCHCKWSPWCCTDAFVPNSWSRPCDWLHTFHTTGTISQLRFLSAASNTFTKLYSGFCWHPSDLLTVHHVVRSACHSLCSEGELSGLIFIICWQIPSGSLVCHSSQRGISIRPNSFCAWVCGRRFLSILVTVLLLLPPEWALCHGHSIAPFVGWLGPWYLQLQPL
jgi:hypothetical protein